MTSSADSALAHDLLVLAERAARAAGDLIRDERPDRLGVSATKTSPTDVVTVMDERSEALLRDLLLRERPDDGLLGEEGGGRAGSTGITWVVDPIDGTVNYLYGLPAYAVSVAAVTGDVRGGDWDVLAGCVHNPASGETFTAARGGGAFLDGRPLRVSDVSDPAQALVATGFGYEAERRRRQAEVVAAVLPQVRDIRRLGSAAIDLCQVACGRVDAYFERGLQPWDMAAGTLVAREAGAIVSGLAGAAPGEQFVLAAGPSLHAALEQILAPLRPDADAV
ncbi:inositol monophosphatase family protein [Angustibacter sp. Root456]|uniref:inositol monophosphatase family protein n=1 Tax=Angustibacter sp. Root456 TaxID=1736539 RepID=UPI0006FF86D1|nr:inositol monophosphatase family protein [Angustibacter sp. Root456]KQX66800.1 inositol monophosphatase [Angustibacter sp. Root456]